MSLYCRSALGLGVMLWLVPIVRAQDKPESASSQPQAVKYIRPLSL